MSAISNREKHRRRWIKYPLLHPNSSVMYDQLQALNDALSEHCENAGRHWSQNEIRVIVAAVHDIFDPLEVARGCTHSLRSPFSVFNAWVEEMWRQIKEEGDLTLFLKAKKAAKDWELI
jgi:hypothetical protein